ncbi:unnamed protein product [Prunus armeniaca]
MGKLANHLCCQIEQVAREIIVGHLCTNYRYTQIRKGNQERGNLANHLCSQIGQATGNEETVQPPVQQPGRRKLVNHLCSQIGQVAREIIVGHLCTKYKYTQIYLKATRNGKTGQPPVQSNRAGGWGNHCRTTNSDLSIGTRKYLKATENEETSQPPVQSNRAGG